MFPQNHFAVFFYILEKKTTHFIHVYDSDKMTGSEEIERRTENTTTTAKTNQH